MQLKTSGTTNVVKCNSSEEGSMEWSFQDQGSKRSVMNTQRFNSWRQELYHLGILLALKLLSYLPFFSPVPIPNRLIFLTIFPEPDP